MSKKSTGRFVVAHTMVDNFPQGTVLHAHDSGRKHGLIKDVNGKEFERTWTHGAPQLIDEVQQDRLLRVGAIREMTPEEAEVAGEDAERLPGPTPPVMGSAPPYSDTEKDAKIQLLERSMGDLADKLKAWEQAAVAGKLAPPKGATMASPDDLASGQVEALRVDLAQKQAEIDRLRESLSEVQSRVADQQGQAGPDDDAPKRRRRTKPTDEAGEDTPKE
jgi:uncharacterized coiled-coil protein SlyX